MNVLTLTLLATFSISSIAFITAGLLSLFPKWLIKITPGLVALAAGTMLSTTFLHLLPESLELLPPTTALQIAFGSFLAFLFIERVFRWHHCHDDHGHDHRSVGYMNLLGDAFHNFVDGMVIAGSFSINPLLGASTTLAIAAHELPQEIGDFGILIHSGMRRRTALIANFLVATTTIWGGITALILSQSVASLDAYLIPFAAGSFLYIAAVDLVPALHKRLGGWETYGLLVMLLIGVSLTPITRYVLDASGVSAEHSHSVSDEHGHIDSNHEDDDHTHEDEDEDAAALSAHE